MATSAEIKIGIVATLIGPYEALGKEGVAGVELAVGEFGGSVAGKKITLAVRGSNAIPDSAVQAVQSLLDEDQVDFVIGPLSGNEGLAVRDFARTRPDRTFLNGCSAAQDLTLRDPAPNFFNFCTNSVQNMAGLGTYAYETLGYRRMVTLGEDYSYPHGLVGGFMIEFCRAGGIIVRRSWVPVGNKNYSEFFASVPADIDAILACVTGNDAIAFVRQYNELDLKIPLMGGSNLFETVVLNAIGAQAARLVGTPSASLVSDGNPDPQWQTLVHAYQKKSPQGAPYPSFSTYGYYLNAKAALLALAQIDARFDAVQDNFRAALSTLEFDSASGTIRLDHNRQVIATTCINVLDQGADGKFYNRLVKTIPNVNQTLGIPEPEYLALGSFGRDTNVELWVEKFGMRK
jgi:branched-chain amino acid transport system substrate-binding protein